MKIFDCHTHATNGFMGYDIEASGKNVIFNSVNEYRSLRSDLSAKDKVSLIFDLSELSFIESEIADGRVNALKIHSRVQKLSLLDYDRFFGALKEFDPKIPIIYDAFYYGEEYKFRPHLEKCIELCLLFPDLPIVVAHCGGYNILKYFLHLRQLENVQYDLSLSLQFFYDSSLRSDFLKLIKFTPCGRVMFGSDYHYGSPSHQVDILSQMLDDLDMPLEEREMIFSKNATELFG